MTCNIKNLIIQTILSVLFIFNWTHNSCGTYSNVNIPVISSKNKAYIIIEQCSATHMESPAYPWQHITEIATEQIADSLSFILLHINIFGVQGDITLDLARAVFSFIWFSKDTIKAYI